MKNSKRNIKPKSDENKKPRRKQRRINIGVIVEIYKLLPAVLNKLFPVPVEMLKWDKGFWFDPKEVEQEEDGKYRDVWSFPQTHPICEQDFIDHFSQKRISEYIAEENALGWRGELFIELKDRDTNHVKSFCLQSCGEDDMYEIDNKLLPVLDSYSVDHVIHRLKNELRLWTFCDTSVYLLDLFIRKILDEADIVWDSCVELSPIYDLVAVPIPGGYSFHNDSVGLVEFRGETGNDPIFIMKSILECEPVSEMQMLAIVGQSAENKRLTNG